MSIFLIPTPCGEGKCMHNNALRSLHSSKHEHRNNRETPCSKCNYLLCLHKASLLSYPKDCILHFNVWIFKVIYREHLGYYYFLFSQLRIKLEACIFLESMQVYEFNTVKFCFSLSCRFTRLPRKDLNRRQRPVPGTSRPRRPPSCPRPQRTRVPVPYRRQPRQCTTRPITTPRCRQILMNGTCKIFSQKDCRNRTGIKDCRKSAYNTRTEKEKKNTRKPKWLV